MDSLRLDTYAHLDSPLHQWDMRYKLIGLFSLIFAFSFVQELPLLPLLIILTLLLFLLSRLPLKFLLTRLQYPGVFLLAVAILLPLFSGSTILVELGPLAIHKEGLLDFLIITVKFVCILTVGLVLFGSAPFLTSIKAMRALWLPPILADMMLLTYHYLFEIGHDLKRMEIAMRMRNFRASRPTWRGIKILASLVGTLFVRSYERSEKIYKAMILRGYGQKKTNGNPAKAIFNAQQKDVILLATTLIITMVIIGAELIIRKKSPLL